jgi:carotenoid cleavage dioxygenase-like enzyme
MKITKVNTVESTLSNKDHPYMQGAWETFYDEFNATNLDVVGEIPKDLEGVYIRNTENQVHEPLGRFHPFDGDGMLHSITFQNGSADYRNRFIQTDGFQVEQKFKKSKWAGLMERPGTSELPGWGAQGCLKDTSSTDVVVHNGKVLTTFYQCGNGYSMDPLTLDPSGKVDWAPIDGISAHTKVDLKTGELLFFNYSKQAPYMHYGVVDQHDNLKHYTPIPLPGPRLPHDMAFTENYSILNDLPLFWDSEMLKRGIHATKLHDLPSRFAVIPRYGTEKDIKWFEANPTYCLHWNNAYESGNEIIVEGYFQENPEPGNYEGAPPGLERMMAFLDNHLLKPRLHRWRFNLETGETIEESLDDKILEFGAINQRYSCENHRFTYSMMPTKGWFTFDGLTKHDHVLGKCETYEFGKGIFGSEVCFAPKINSQDEDDGYLVSIITNVNNKTSSCVLFNAKDIVSGPICSIPLPQQVCSGTHATWAQMNEIMS